MQQMSRRSLITGLISLVAAPAIVRASNLMPVKQMLAEPTMRFMGYGGGFSTHPDLYAELARVTRQALLPRLQGRICAKSPALFAMYGAR